MRSVLFQYASGQPFERMLDSTEPLHRAYCEDHDLEYVRDSSEFEPSYKMACRGWATVKFMHFVKTLNNGDIAAHIDADCVIVNPEIDLRESLRGGYDLALVGDPLFVNSGVMVAIKSDRLIDLFDRAMSNTRVETRFFDVVFHDEIVKHCARVCRLGDRWNWYSQYGDEHCERATDCEESAAIIRGFHGMARGRALDQVQDTVERMCKRGK